MSEVKCYCVAIGNLPIFRRRKMAGEIVEFIKKLDGLVGVHPHYPHGNLIIFRTENQAKIAKNMMNAQGIPTGKNIGEVFIDEQYLGGQDEKVH